MFRQTSEGVHPSEGSGCFEGQVSRGVLVRRDFFLRDCVGWKEATLRSLELQRGRNLVHRNRFRGPLAARLFPIWNRKTFIQGGVSAHGTALAPSRQPNVSLPSACDFCWRPRPGEFRPIAAALENSKRPNSPRRGWRVAKRDRFY